LLLAHRAIGIHTVDLLAVIANRIIGKRIECKIAALRDTVVPAFGIINDQVQLAVITPGIRERVTMKKMICAVL
jgi:hypothetical protein